ncbi:peptidoglycan-binding domain-containing protein, partial [Clostridioides difficile]
FGRKTYNAVVSVQKQYGLSADGVIGPATWDKLGRLTDSSF